LLPEAADRWVFAGLAALLAWAPLPLGSNRTWAIGILALWLAGLTVAAALVWRGRGSAAFERLAAFRLPLALFAGWALLAWAQTLPLPVAVVAWLSPAAAAGQQDAAVASLSLDVYQSQRMAALACLYGTVFGLAVLTVRSAARLERLALVLVWSGVAQAVLGAVLFSVGARYRIFHVEVNHARLIGSFVYHNSAAGYLVMCLSVGIGLMLGRLRGGAVGHGWRARAAAALGFLLSGKMRLRLTLVVMVVALVLTRSRMGNAAFFTSLLLVGAVAILLVRRRAPATIMLIASLMVVDVAVIGGWIGVERVVQRLGDTALTEAAGGREESVETRSEAARLGLGIVADFPLAGTGGGSFYGSFMGYRSSRPGYIDHAHNDYVEIAADFGIPGLLLALGLGGSALVTALRVLARRHSRLYQGIAFGGAMSVVALAMHSLTDFNLQIPANALTFCVVLAMIWLADRLPPAAGNATGAAG
jgi:O-antigen ligase